MSGEELNKLAEVNAKMREALLQIERECGRCRGEQSYKDTIGHVGRIARRAAAIRARATLADGDPT